MRYSFIVAAAGVGKRMGLGYPKQFLEHNGKPIFIHTLEKIEKCTLVDEIVVVTNKDFLADVENMIKKYNITKALKIVEGGKERQDSVYNALKNTVGEIVGIQDGVRPFIKEKYIVECYNMLMNNDEYDGIVVGVKSKDTVKIINSAGIVESTPDRKNVISVHTPQVFKRKKLIEAYEKAFAENFLGTDDSMLVERINGKVKFFEGDYDNVKITTPEDLIHLNETVG